MTASLRPPTPASARSGGRFLSRADRRARRRGGAGSGYSLAALALFYGPSLVIGCVFELTGPPVGHAVTTGPACLAALIAALAAVSAGWSYLGPISAPPAWVTWVLATPLDRGVLLVRRAWARLAVSILPGAALGTAAAAAGGLRGAAAAAVVVLGTAGGVVACAVAIWRQRGERRGAWKPWAVTVLAAGIAAIAQVWSVGPIPILWWWICAAAVGLGAVVAVVEALLSLRRIPMGRLIGAHRIAAGVFMAFTDMSLEAIGHDGPSTRRTSARYRPLRGVGQEALTAMCWRRLRRNTIGLVRFAISIAVLYPLALAGGDVRAILAAAGVLAASVAVSGIAGTARRFQHHPHLPAHLGLDTKSSRNTALTVPAIAAGLWAILVAPAMTIGGTAVSAVISAALGYGVVTYRLTRPEFAPSYAMGQHYSLDVARRLSRGPIQLVGACVLAAIAAMAT